MNTISPVFETDPRKELAALQGRRFSLNGERIDADRSGSPNAARSLARAVRGLDADIAQLRRIIKRGQYSVL